MYYERLFLTILDLLKTLDEIFYYEMPITVCRTIAEFSISAPRDKVSLMALKVLTKLIIAVQDDEEVGR